MKAELPSSVKEAVYQKKATAKGQILHSIVLEASRSKVLSDRGIDGKGPGSKIQKKPADIGGWIWEISR